MIPTDPDAALFAMLQAEKPAGWSLIRTDDGRYTLRPPDRAFKIRLVAYATRLWAARCTSGLWSERLALNGRDLDSVRGFYRWAQETTPACFR